jgi:type 1 glutamine amidotransferase
MLDSMRQPRVWIAAGLFALSCSSPARPSNGPPSPGGGPGGPPSPPGAAPVRALVLTSTAGFRHDSIGTAVQTLQLLAQSTGEFTVTRTENVADVTAAALGSQDVLMFVLTSGELAFDEAQKTAILAFVSGGGGFIGIHSATDTLYSWPDYGRLVGAFFKEHPWTQDAAVTVEDRAHASTSTLGPSFRILEEFYTFRENPRPSVNVLLSLDAASVGASGDFPLAWAQPFGAGRAYYNALGHFSSTWTDTRFQSQLRGAIRWAAGRS